MKFETSAKFLRLPNVQQLSTLTKAIWRHTEYSTVAWWILDVLVNSRIECIANCGHPTSIVWIPKRVASIGPTVEPHGMSFLTAIFCKLLCTKLKFPEQHLSHICEVAATRSKACCIGRFPSNSLLIGTFICKNSQDPSISVIRQCTQLLLYFGVLVRNKVMQCILKAYTCSGTCARLAICFRTLCVIAVVA